MKKTLALIVGLAVLGSAFLPAQNLLDNEDYRRARELRQMAQEAYDAGEYEQAAEYSVEAEEYFERSIETARRLREGYRAENFRSRNERRLNRARDRDFHNLFDEEFSEAQDLYDEGRALLDDEEYGESIERFSDSIAKLDEMDAMYTEKDVLPRYYEVRLIPERRDSFWRIAEYEFVYDDPWEWPRLYERNKEVLRDPDNPHLIHPGQVFEIPERDGEVREGQWDPDN